MKKHELDDAWQQMQNRMKEEPKSEKWASFSAQLRKDPLQADPAQPSQAITTTRSLAAEKAPVRLSTPSTSEQPVRRSEWLRKHRRWIAGAAAVCVLGLTLATPAGNQVLASLQNQFRMEQVTAVEEQSLRELFNTIGLTESTMNRYGEFSHSSEGGFESFASLEELQAHVNRKLVIPALFQDKAQQKLSIEASPSRKITMKINVEEINTTMRKLGAETLLPQSIDGKPLTLTMGRAVRIAHAPDNSQSPYTFTQQPVPSLTVEEGVPVAEAFEAVLQFPLIPTELKQALMQSNVLDSGSAPLPVVVPEGYNEHQVANIKMLWKYSPSESRYSAVWTQGGQLFTFSGVFPDQDDFTSMLEEMIRS